MQTQKNPLKTNDEFTQPNSAFARENAVEVKNLTHYYGKKMIYENLSFTVPKGCVFGILGRNGVGKSTLINILMGYIHPKGGECKVLGKESFNLDNEAKRDIALLFEGFISYDYLSIAQYERFLKPFYPKWDSKIYKELVKLLGLNENQKLNSMSFGQKSQVILASLFAQDAKVLIFDDYSMGLDAGYRRLFGDYLKDYLDGKDKTVIITSHIMSDLQDLVDEFIIVERGGQVYQSSMSEFMREFRVYKVGLDRDLSKFGFKNIDKFKNHQMAYGFCQIDDEMPINATFEDKFLGFVGRYE
ncbi:ATP-binding cassette domain-containing protein [Campylobacter geochelonis]|uniref:Methyltransferase n=1 Tax=Campylobacter geochelonis TaxID=1780362 RepID=A0A128EFW3_9BACT|nr:ABC transporter ATP-binding protein [Campylobacter geochelonis]QKF71950.1 ABC transporter, ATP-binding protein [Campylobacter geochelonis]CZE47819.1 methyltransferase [Campylobacter geochelonis]CZE49971.1 methyltransferase [Campylobacter geochelonis]